MKTYKHFTPYIPKDKKRKSLSSMGYEFLHDEDNNDWYEVQSTFSSDTLKLAYADDGSIDSVSFDVTALVPRNLSVSEVAKENIPEGFFDSGKWMFNDNEIIPYEYTHDELIAQAEAEKQKLISSAMEVVAPIQLKLQAGRSLSDDESTKLNAVLDYIDSVEATDLTHAPDIIWPDITW